MFINIIFNSYLSASLNVWIGDWINAQIIIKKEIELMQFISTQTVATPPSIVVVVLFIDIAIGLEYFVDCWVF